MAKDLMPRVQATFTRTPKIEDKDFNSIHFDIQRFVSTLRKNEELDSFVTRKDDGKTMEITIGFSDHEAMKGIQKSMAEMLRKLGRKTGVKVKVDVYEPK